MTEHPRLIWLAALAVASLLPSTALPCTAFSLGQGEQIVMGKSYDWDFGNGLVVVNKRGVAKRGVPMKPADRPPSWVSKYGSVTFNQFGREMPNGGMNEAGLAMEVLWLNESAFPAPDDRPALNELQFVQWALDNHATVAELLAAATRVRVSKVYGAVHYFACDPTGACACLEFLEGKLVATAGGSLPANAIANNSCAHSGQALQALKKAKQPAPKGNGSSARYLRAATMIEATGPKADPKARAVEMLDSVSQGSFTQWGIVYELKGQKVHFRSLQASALKVIDLAKLDFSCGTPARTLDVNSKLKGEVTDKLEEYTTAANEQLIRASLSLVRLALPEATVKQLAEYPTHLPCAAAQPAP